MGLLELQVHLAHLLVKDGALQLQDAALPVHQGRGKPAGIPTTSTKGTIDKLHPPMTEPISPSLSLFSNADHSYDGSACKR